jgi:hypothetical protein
MRLENDALADEGTRELAHAAFRGHLRAASPGQPIAMPEDARAPVHLAHRGHIAVRKIRTENDLLV